ncbi:branched-chain amino acid transport system substrate-binding protein [Evansella vedderi]|uniref:Branched-chain amino acid transport system substrate-binding protein n=1 Tax=Evansella vedderi TaxID=38282 RepID=A0ABU0A0A2_9BACI|nr:substrate-binding domain-containing protein [Evansella vedderi]MDQ0256912.1 branched-chain amino acid transport system substrate-binding protein [Evansella vedderi]
MKRGLRSFLLLLVSFFLVLLVACGDDDVDADPPADTGNGGETAGEDSDDDDESEKEAEVSGDPIKIGILTSQTGILEAYGNQMIKGFEIGLDYATNGTRAVNGRPIELIIRDTQTDPQVAVQQATELYENEEVDILVGAASSGDTLAVLPLAEVYDRIMIVEPAVADAITGSEWNPNIFRTGRNSSQDAVAGAAAIASEGTDIAILAPNYAFGLDGAAAFKEAAEALGANIVLEEFPAPDATDFTASIQRIIDSNPEYLFVIWAGANSPWQALQEMGVKDRGITISTGAPDIAALYTMDDLIGMEGFSVYHYTLPSNPVNDYLVEEHKSRHNGEVPDLFTAGGMASAMAAVEALTKTNGDASADALREAMKGMTFDSPKGPMTFRTEDHQALQTLYAIELQDHPDYDYPLPVLLRELSPEETAPPIRN